ncbi:hypothetical protein AU468_01260 [Alkalispirochaeta sphaeroplastigenens]|uniref:Phosphatidic acid phosphatase type 2/haloperoxidase domain-containing protein n=1 Tax=Alkalispirochaeta sphaeroplastigenens TaxID=1187066 RepID=A0A2S4K0P9_9SPIO|nr:phosphatase PAP2 family protein [Alkalispirochaeta sphaeroplastigenens]POR05337.1 hypothetical protein AU468_01260 [Alkalispirochaeta sphaeroplastigenens]
MTRRIFSFLALAILVLPGGALGALPWDWYEVSPDFPYELSLRREVAITATGLGLTGLSYLLEETNPHTTAAEYGPERLDKGDINPLDRLAVNRYNETLQVTGHALFFVALLAPFPAAANRNFSELFTLGMMYGQTLLLSYGSKETLLHFFPRYRPHAYYDDTPDEHMTDQGSRKSFFSGHATHTFAAATFATVIMADLEMERRTRYLVSATSYGLATGVAVSRVAAGRHFITDVAAGMVWGSAVGWLVPALHRRSEAAPFHLSPLLGEEGLGLQVSVPF